MLELEFCGLSRRAFFNLGVAVAEDVTHHLPQVLLSISVLPLELLHALLAPHGEIPIASSMSKGHPGRKFQQTLLRAAYACTT